MQNNGSKIAAILKAHALALNQVTPLHEPHFSGSENGHEGRRHGGNQTGTIPMIGPENDTRTSCLPPGIDGDRKIVRLPPASAECVVLFRMVAIWRSLGKRDKAMNSRLYEITHCLSRIASFCSTN